VLLVITNNTIYSLDKLGKRSAIVNEVAYSILQSKLDPNRVYIGLARGLMSIYRANDKWIIEKPYYKIDMAVNSLSEDQTGNLWMGSEDNGVAKLHIESILNDRIKDYKITCYDTTGGLPPGPYFFEIIDAKVLLATSKGICKYSIAQNAFQKDSLFGYAFMNGKYWIHRIKLDNQDRFWVVAFNEEAGNTYELGYFNRNDKYHWHAKPFKKISENVIHAIYP
jgi:ligand-binding sensor domain-containing protein